MNITALLADLGVDYSALAGQDITARSPRDGSTIAVLRSHSASEVQHAIDTAAQAALQWRNEPAPLRGELVRQLGQVLREKREALGQLVTLESGKILSEGIGEVQEMIDICDFAVGLSRQLHGLTIASERPGHRMMETWHPLGVCGVITAFNFPVAVWAWNAALALVCGNAVIWKPSEKTPLTALAVHSLLQQAIARHHRQAAVPAALCQVLIGGAAIGAALSRSPAVALVSATGSVAMGRKVAAEVAQRLGRSLLELGGNNGMIVAPSADLDLALRAIVFSAVGTAGQRCTSLRRLFIERRTFDALTARIERVYATLSIGDPLAAGTLVGPLIDAQAYSNMQAALAQAQSEGGVISGGERIAGPGGDQAFYVRPALVRMPQQSAVMHHETFAPILYALPYDDFSQAIALNNAVPQGLSSAIFTNDMREAELFMSANGSDCGLANVNIGTSGAEIGGAFGGEKETGGGRESGSDAWKAYMRRATNTINYSGALPLAQGVSFDIG